MKSSQSPKSAGFTLIEIIVVMIIIVLLVGIALPMLMRANRQAKRIRTQGDFQTISLALEQYHTDFGDYPQLPVAYQSGDPQSGTGQTDRNTGAATLGKALLGPFGDGFLNNSSGFPDPTKTDAADPPLYQSPQPYTAGQCVVNSGSYYVAIQNVNGGAALNSTNYAWFDPRDGADGPGFRLHAGGGKTWGPYIPLEKVKLSGVDILDVQGNPILYFPLRAGKPTLTSSSKLSSTDASGNKIAYWPYVDQFDQSYVNANNNLQVFHHVEDTSASLMAARDRIRIMLGDSNANGFIDTNNGPETPIDAKFILWSAGPDGIFGPANFVPDNTGSNVDANRQAVQNCDDVTNFRP